MVTYKDNCSFDHSDSPAHSVFTFDASWGSMGTIIFGNASSAASNTQSRLPSRLSFRFLWLWPHPSCFLTSIKSKTHHGPLLLFFLCNFSSFFSHVARIPVTNHFSLLASYIDRHILANQQFITHNEHWRYLFWSAAIFWTSSEALAPWSSQQKEAKTASKSFFLSSS